MTLMKLIQPLRPSLGLCVAATLLLLPSLSIPAPAEEPAKEVTPPAGKEAPKDPGEALELPGLKIRVKERCVDVDATVCLETGMLELIACTKGSKEHEAIISVDAKAAHIHAALLLLGAKPGNPAMRKPVDKEGTRWVDLPPRGGEVDVFLVFKGEDGVMKEHPISDFLIRAADDFSGNPAPEEDPKKRRFPTHTFLFAGSHLWKNGDQPPQYLADESGNVLSLATFGDELLCLPGVHANENDGLVWEVDSTHLPAMGKKVLMRLRPKLPEQGK
jgi:hypothetical protein